jgi:pilus assembly protein FimV
MALFGFNKAKVLAAAEKFVQQGKLQNAITEYEKVVKEDPKDLTVLNTIGDLSARVGKNEQAAKYFQKVGEAYAHDGFTVKAIAMYKKLTKLDPSYMEGVMRLAELYTVQGLYNDARQQYVTVADFWLKNNQNEDAAKVFQKILELDPDNTAMQTKLADLYIKLGKKTEARNIYYTAAQSLYSKSAMDAADEALAKVLALDPKNVDALLLRGAIAAESGDGASALKYLKDIPDVDSRPDALRSLLRAHIQQNHMDEAVPISSKLVNVHNDLSGVSWLADAMLNAGKSAQALEIYAQYADKLLAANGPALVKTLAAVITKVKESAKALESLREIFQKAGDTTHDHEIMELLAHAYVTEQQYDKAKDLYKHLAEHEPENPLHAQNYKQVIGLLGQDSTSKPLTAEQGSQALMMEEVDHHKAPQIDYGYPKEVATAVHQALTDAELFDSYNLPAKAIPPLEAGLRSAPRDHQINQRLAMLYAKVERYMDAARCCNTLKDVFAEHGYTAEAAKYGEMAAKYLTATPSKIAEASAAGEDMGSVSLLSLSQTAAAGQEGFAASSVGAFSMEVAAPQPPPPASAAETPAYTASAVAEVEVAPPTTPALEVAAPAAPDAAHEITIDSNEWESMLVEEPPTRPAAPEPAAISMEVAPPPAEISMPVEPAPSSFEVPVEPAPAESGAVAEFSFESVSESTPEPVVAPPPPPAPAPPKVVAPPPPPPAPPKPAPAPVAAAPATPAPAPTRKEEEELDLLGDLVGDLEAALGEGGFGAPPAPQPKAAPKPAVAPPPPSGPVAAPAPMAATSAAAPAPAPVATAPVIPAPAPVAPETVPAGFSSIGHELPQEAPAIEHHEAKSALSDLFDEFKEDAEAAATEAEDPDTHYNLGIAFKEMGLLDEAIGELQKVCKAVEHGHPFSQAIQAYTWLAQCLVDKGVPQAAVRWYEKALQVKDMNEDSRLAVYYDLACAHELAGNQKKAYDTFMEVYSSNIDYRDVADRLKALKA